MRVNTSRGRRFSFGQAAAVYDRARPRFSRAFVDEMLLHSGIRGPSTVMEIGAGTGQLTRALLERGMSVLALEPDKRLAAILRELPPGAGQLVVREEDFEGFAARAELPQIDLIVAANSYHWLDPAISHSSCARIVGRGGRMFLTWNFPVLREPALQRRLNETVFTDALADLARDPDGHLSTVEDLCRQGREELRSSGALRPLRWAFELESFHWDRAQLASLLSTYAGAVELGAEIEARLFRALPADARVELENVLYYVVAESLA
jgi:SAM-dependent methyltransferase